MISRLLGICFFVLNLTFSANGQCIFSCNNQINIGLDENCSVDVTLDMLTEGSAQAGCNFSFTIEGVIGSLIEEPGSYQFHVYLDDDVVCGGTILAEDKIPPILNCECESIYQDFDQYNGYLNLASPTFLRPQTTGTDCQSSIESPLEVFEFFIEVPGPTSIELITLNMQGTNSFLALYKDCFNINLPCENLLSISQDAVTLGFAQIQTILEEGVTYYLVASSLDGTLTGSFSIDASSANASIKSKNPNCVFSCTDLFEPSIFNQLFPPIQEPIDNCGDYQSIQTSFEVIELDHCNDKIVRRTQSSQYYSGPHLTTTYCVEEYLFESIQLTGAGRTISGDWEEYPLPPTHQYYFPEPDIILPCGSNALPSYIADFFDIDTPGRPFGKDQDDYQSTPGIVENNEGVPYAGPYYVALGEDGKFYAQLINDNVCNLYIGFQDQLYDICGAGCYGNSKIVRTWSLIDWCKGTSEYFEQKINVTDIDGPNISVADVTVSVNPWDCTADVNMPQPEHLSDVCDANLSYWIEAPPGVFMLDNKAINVPKGIHTFNYHGEDCCGNTSVTQMHLYVVDDTPPVAIAKQDIVIQLTTDVVENGQALLYAKDVDDYSHDGGCGDVLVEIRRADSNSEVCHTGNYTYNNNGDSFDSDDDPDGGAFVKFCCEDLVYIDDDGSYYGTYDVKIRVWDDGNGDGILGNTGDNYNEAWSTIRVEDKLAPIVVCPEHIELVCEQDFNDYVLTGTPYAFGPCHEYYCGEPSNKYETKPANSQPFWGEEIKAFQPSCRQGAIKRTWICGVKTCTQWIIVRGSELGPVDIEWPEDQTVNCLGESSEEPIVEDRFCEQIGVSLKSDTFYAEAGACYKILNHWSVINWCDYDPDDPDNNDIPEPGLDDGYIAGVHSHIQVIRLYDSQFPELTVKDTCYGSNAICESEGIRLDGYVLDQGDCASDWLKWEVEIDLWSDWVVDYTYSTYLPQDDEFYLPPTGNGPLHIDFPDGIEGTCSQEHRIHWTVEDGCGNLTGATQFVEIRDKKKPTPYCLNISTAVMQNGTVEIWAKDFNAGSFDNCTYEDELIYTFSSIPPPPYAEEEHEYYNDEGSSSVSDYLKGNAEKWNATLGTTGMFFTCDQLEEANENGGLLTLDVYVWDKCGNNDHCLVNLKLSDNQEVCGPTTPRAMIAGTVRRENGEALENMEVNIMADFPTYPVQTMTDASGLYIFENNLMGLSYELTGVDSDDWLNGISTLDLVLIQRHILSSVVFENPYTLIAADVNADEKITAIDLISLRKLILGVNSEIEGNTSWKLIPSTQQMSVDQPWPFDEYILVHELENDVVDNDFVALKVGDVNGSASLGLQGELVESRENQSLGLDIQYFSVDSVNYLSFKGTDELDLHGIQFTLSGIEAEISEIIAKSMDVAESNFSWKDGKLAFSWHGLAPIDATDTWFTLALRGEKMFDKGSKSVQLFKSNMANEAYTGDELSIMDLHQEALEQVAHIGLTNYPNPWTNETFVEYTLVAGGDVQFELFTNDGKLIKAWSHFGKVGLNNLSIDHTELNGNQGLIYLKVSTSSQTEVLKMIFF